MAKLETSGETGFDPRAQSTARLRVPLRTSTAVWLTDQVAGFMTSLGTPVEIKKSPRGRIASITGAPRAISRFEQTLHDAAGVYREVAADEGATALSIEIALKSTFDLHRTRFEQGLEA